MVAKGEAMLFRTAVAVVVVLSASLGSATDYVLTVDPSSSKVSFALGATLHTVHGTATISDGEIFIDTEAGRVSGEVSVDAVSAETGNRSRDKKMHRSVLRSDKYPLIVFRPETLEGVLEFGGENALTMIGSIELGGSRHEVRIPITARIESDRFAATASFEVPYVKWGLSDPSNLVLRVDKLVTVSVYVEGAVAHHP